jgi:Na+/melibiose symporter-like transporter
VHHIPTTPGAQIHIIPVLASIIGIALLVWGVLNGGEHGEWLAAGTLVPLVIGVLVLAGLVIAEARSPHPVADVRLFRRASFTIAVIAMLLASFAIYGYMYITTFFLEVQRGYTPFQTGLIFIPLSVGILIGSPAANRLSIAIGPRATIIIGLLLATIGLGALAFMGRDTALVWILIEMLVVALGFGLLLTPATSLATADLPPHQAAGGSALMNTLRQIASALGVAILGSLLWSTYGSHLAPALTGVPAPEQAAMTQSLAATLGAAAAHPQFAAAHPQLLETARTAFDTAIHLGALVAAGTVLIAAIITLIVRPARTAPQETDQPEA